MIKPPPPIGAAQNRQALLEYQALLDNVALGIAFIRDGCFLHCNSRFSEIFGWPGEQLAGQPASLLHPSAQAGAELSSLASATLGRRQPFDTELLLQKRDRSMCWCRLRINTIDPADPDQGQIYLIEDITERRADDASAQRLLLEHQAILDNVSLAITFTRKRHFLHCNQRFSEMFGWPSDELIQQTTDALYPSPQAFAELSSLARATLGRGERLDTELLMRRRDGSTFWCRLLAKAIDPDDLGRGSIYITEDITDRRLAQEALVRARDTLELRVQERTAELATANQRLQAEIQERLQAEKQIRHLADHDALTDLPNRRLLEDRLRQAMAAARRSGNQVAVMFIDLDSFKPINDLLGHRVGDLLLQAVAKRLRGLLRAVDTVARIGGDEFVLVLPDMHSQSTSSGESAKRILAALVQPYQIDGNILTVTPSIGISHYPEHGSNVDALIARADDAMYRAKQMGRRNYQFYIDPRKE
ncbi:diguanylate cyclase domain-containing protein [Herminiimonas sp. CN]|uniref:sensor domain-containing protein n=1 Tax=Herminiimonas sp. CN TaxID=1349818 RepID=UPI0012DF5890|nr:diguanylate cyclase [Herminiimonas sp. CN]